MTQPDLPPDVVENYLQTARRVLGIRELVGEVHVQPVDDGPKQLFFGPLLLLLWDDGSVTWRHDE